MSTMGSCRFRSDFVLSGEAYIFLNRRLPGYNVEQFRSQRLEGQSVTANNDCRRQSRRPVACCLQTVKSISVVLVLLRIRDWEMLEVFFDIGFSHLMSYWSQWCQFDYSHQHALESLSVYARSITYSRYARICTWRQK